MSAGPHLRQLETSGLDPRSSELLVALAWLVSGELGFDENELRASRRRAMLVLVAGGDPHRDLDLDAAAAERLGAELDTEARRAALASALDALAADAEGLPAVTAGLDALRSEPELAWRSLSVALLADELVDE
jgi:hypothetical protein